MNGKETIQSTYQKLSQLQHILKRPDSYIGSIDKSQRMAWVYNDRKNTIQHRNIIYVPGLYKIFDEIIVNAADNYHRDHRMRYIKVNINKDIPEITVENDGKGIPNEIHKKEKMYVAQMIFGQLLTSSNYNDDEAKVVGGRNGYGAKLTNIYSTEFKIVTADYNNRNILEKRWYDNMYKKDDVVIRKYPTQEEPDKRHTFTRITFRPDLKRFGMRIFDRDIYDLMARRVVDIAGITPKTVQVYLNGKVLKISSFYDYFKLYQKVISKAQDQEDNDDDIQNNSSKVNQVGIKWAKEETKKDNGDNGMVIAHEKVNDRWQVIAAVITTGQFEQVSFVNAINTSKGGTHVDYITEQIVSNAVSIASKKAKNIKISPAQVKTHLMVFVNCLIENPTFDSQTKDTLTLKKDKYGSKCELSNSFLKVISNNGLINLIIEFAKFKQLKSMEFKMNKGKKNRLINIQKLEDANMAGGRRSQECTLILTEGDSAKALAMAGLEVIGRDFYGVYPLRGKMLNVRDSSLKSIKENREVQQLTDILGLQISKTYRSRDEMKDLRYGKVLIMADQDQDGSHIKGLVINFIYFFWPSLIQQNLYVEEFITPILKAIKGKGASKETKPFFTIQEFKRWAQSVNIQRSWNIKYYKGLGTSTSDQGRDYFSEIDRHVVKFQRRSIEDDRAIEMAFKKDQVAQRKEWLSSYDEDQFLEMGSGTFSNVTYKDFVYKELIHFSMADTVRSIPSMCDGLKPGQRKIMFACFKRNLKGEIKVAQLAGYVGQHTQYHHGEQALKSTIIGLAQDYVGSNNVNLLMPIGQFGTRNMSGKDHASARYIFTTLNKVTRKLFHPDDDKLFNYRLQDGHRVEPDWFLPILPTVLINGSEGIGTGWSSSTPKFNPVQLALAFKQRIQQGKKFGAFKPWIRGWSGDIREVNVSDLLKPKKSSKTIKKKGKTSDDEDSMMLRLDNHFKGSEDCKSSCDAEEINSAIVINNDDENYNEDNENNFFGQSISSGASRKYTHHGILQIDRDDIQNRIIIKELPIKKSTRDYKLFLQSLLEFNKKEQAKQAKQAAKPAAAPKNTKKGKAVKGGKKKEIKQAPKNLSQFDITDIREYHTERKVHFQIRLTDQSWKKIIKYSDSMLMQKLKLEGNLSMSNIILFDCNKKLKKYANPEDVCQDFYQIRVKFYHKRHTYLLRMLRKEECIKSYKAKFISLVNEQKIKINKRNSLQVVQILRQNQFQSMSEIEKRFSDPQLQQSNVVLTSNLNEEKDQAQRQADSDNSDEEDKSVRASGITDFDYLLKMPMSSMTKQKAKKLLREKAEIQERVRIMEETKPQNLWLQDIQSFLQEYYSYEQDILKKQEINEQKMLKRKGVKKGVGKRDKGNKMNNNSNTNITSFIDVQKKAKMKDVSKAKSKPMTKATVDQDFFKPKSPKAKESNENPIQTVSNIRKFLERQQQNKNTVLSVRDFLNQYSSSPKKVYSEQPKAQNIFNQQAKFPKEDERPINTKSKIIQSDSDEELQL